MREEAVSGGSLTVDDRMKGKKRESNTSLYLQVIMDPKATYIK